MLESVFYLNLNIDNFQYLGLINDDIKHKNYIIKKLLKQINLYCIII